MSSAHRVRGLGLVTFVALALTGGPVQAAPVAQSSGDRLVLAPQELNPDTSHAQVRALARTIADDRNVVALVHADHDRGSHDHAPCVFTYNA